MVDIEINPKDIIDGLEEQCWQCVGITKEHRLRMGEGWIGDDANPDAC